MGLRKEKLLCTVYTSTGAALSTLTISELKDRFSAKLEGSDLNAGDARLLKFEPHTAQQATQKLNGNLPANKAGFVIPYFDLHGKPTKFWRYRYLETTKEGFDKLTDRKDLRYAQPPKSLNELYLPPFVDWKQISKDATKPILITEGELKAACACKHHIACIGLGGVWSWRSARALMPMLPQFQDFAWDGRPVTICYDSDAASNGKVMAAENALAAALTDLGAVVDIARIPPGPKGRKMGVDDVIVEQGIRSMVKILDGAIGFKACEELHKLNGEVVYVEDPGLILRLDNNQRMRPSDFTAHAYAPRIYYEQIETEKGVKIQEKSAAKEWIKWPRRATVKRTTYAPGAPTITPANELNLWEGWGCEPAKGDIKPWRDLLDFLFHNATTEHRKWVEQWMAYPLQFPGTKLYTALVVWGLVHGTGKSTIGYTLGEIYGKNFIEIKDSDLEMSHNDWAVHKQLVMGDEITGGDKRSSADRMKTLITQRQLRINEKYVPGYSVPDCINYIFTSNHPDAFFLDDTDRRYFVHEVMGRPLEPEFYAHYQQWLQHGGAAALFHHLLTLDLDGFNPQGHAPMTASKQDMVETGKSDLGAWVMYLRQSPGSVLRIHNKVIERDLWTSTELLALYDPSNTGRVTLNGMGRELRRAGFVRAYNGMPIPTHQGLQRLWVICNEEKYENMRMTDIGRIFDNERGVKDGKAKF